MQKLNHMDSSECLTMFLIGLYDVTARLRYGESDVLRVCLLCEMRNLHLLYFFFNACHPEVFNTYINTQ